MHKGCGNARKKARSYIRIKRKENWSNPSAVQSSVSANEKMDYCRTHRPREAKGSVTTLTTSSRSNFKSTGKCLDKSSCSGKAILLVLCPGINNCAIEQDNLLFLLPLPSVLLLQHHDRHLSNNQWGRGISSDRHGEQYKKQNRFLKGI